jgi:hypothetical protein
MIIGVGHMMMCKESSQTQTQILSDGPEKDILRPAKYTKHFYQTVVQQYI